MAIGRLIAAAVERELERNPGLKIRYLGASDAATEQADETLITTPSGTCSTTPSATPTRKDPVEIVVETEEEEVVVRVLDRGPGAGRRERPGTGSSRPARPAGRAGGGLGLFVAARLIQAMNGRSWARSRPGGGAEFGFALRRSVDPPRPVVV